MNRTRRRLACDWSKQRAQLSARSELIRPDDHVDGLSARSELTDHVL